MKTLRLCLYPLNSKYSRMSSLRMRLALLSSGFGVDCTHCKFVCEEEVWAGCRGREVKIDRWQTVSMKFNDRQTETQRDSERSTYFVIQCTEYFCTHSSFQLI